MALIKCGECENDISEKAITCPHCGNTSLEFEKRKLYFDLLSGGVKDKFEVLPFAAGLSAALLTIFSINLFPLNNFIKIIISVLLINIGICLIIYMSETTKSIAAVYEKLDENLGREIKKRSLSFWGSVKFLLFADENGVQSNKKFPERFASQLPSYVVSLISIVILIMLCLLWLSPSNGQRKITNHQIKYYPHHHRMPFHNF